MVQQRLTEAPTLYTIGYEGRHLAGFIELLLEVGIEHLVDVRANPWSRKPGFTQGPLSEGLEAAGVGYTHLGALGAPRQLRQGEVSAKAFAEGYRDHLAAQGAALDRLTSLARAAPTAIMCMEAKASECHRRFIAEHLAGQGWAIVHLG